MVGTWLARVGAIAVLIGGAFAYSYAVDRGLIGPPARVAIGVLVGVAFAAAGEWARRRGWLGWAQAVTGGAVGIWYLAVWAASQRYALIDEGAALAALTLVTVTAVSLALRHRSEPLAVLATVGALLNPFLVGIEGAVPLLTYLLLVAMGAAVLGGLREWRSLGRVALIGTWLTVGFGEVFARGPSLPVALLFGTAVFAVFTAAQLVPVWLGSRSAAPKDAPLVASNSGAYALYAMGHLATDADGWLGGFAILLGLVHMALAASLTRHESRALVGTLLAIAVSLFVAAVPLQFEGPVVPAVWTAQAIAMVVIGNRSGSEVLALAGLALLAFAILDVAILEFELGEAYRPPRILLSGEAALLAMQVATLGAAAHSLPGNTQILRGGVMVAAHVLALTWLTFEVRAAAGPSTDLWLTSARDQTVAFATTTVWALYAVSLLVIGITIRSMFARRLAVAILGAVVVKLVLSDLWLLGTLYRTVAFIGLGGLLLASSLLYHRLRDALIGEGSS